MVRPMNRSSTPARWDPLSTIALLTLTVVLVLVLERVTRLRQTFEASRLGWLESVVALGISAAAIALFLAGRRWRQLQATIASEAAAVAHARMLFETSPLPTWVFDHETLRFVDV